MAPLDQDGREDALPISDAPPGDTEQAPRPRLSVIVCATNEAQNIPRLLDGVLSSSGPSFQLTELIAVASGCTDRTVEILEATARLDPRVRVVVQPERRGKASALRAGLTIASGELILVENADTVPAPGALEAITAPFRNPDVGLVTARPVPAAGVRAVTTTLGQLLWEIHDVVSELTPKAGEAYAFRRVPIALPEDIQDDDTFIGISVGRRSVTSVYAREAIIYNRVPSIPSELVRQRLRVNRQVFALWRSTGYRTGTWRFALMVKALAIFLRRRPRAIPAFIVFATFELSVRAVAMILAVLSPRPIRAWASLPTTKWAIDAPSDGGPKPSRTGSSVELGK